MIRVLHYGLNINRGGIETYLYKICTHIDRTAFRFDFIDEWGGNAFYRKEFESMGARFFDVAHRKESISQNRKDIRSVFTENRPDIVHCHLNTLSYITPVMVALELGIPVIVHSRSAGAGNKAITRLLHYINKRRLKGKDITRLAVSTEAGRWLFDKHDSFACINNGIDIGRFRYSAKKRDAVRTMLGIDADTMVIGNVGSLSYPKNHLFLIDIFEAIQRKASNSVLVIVGSGSQKNELVERVHAFGLTEKVLLLENRNDIPDLLSSFDVFVMPSLFEGFPNAAIEAQTSGLPCYLSNRITREVGINQVEFIPLEDGAEHWADRICNYNRAVIREEGAVAVSKAGLSVKDEVEKISNIYESLVK